MIVYIFYLYTHHYTSFDIFGHAPWDISRHTGVPSVLFLFFRQRRLLFERRVLLLLRVSRQHKTGVLVTRFFSVNDSD